MYDVVFRASKDHDILRSETETWMAPMSFPLPAVWISPQVTAQYRHAKWQTLDGILYTDYLLETHQGSVLLPPFRLRSRYFMYLT